MAQQDNIFNLRMVKKKGKLVYADSGVALQMKEFIKSLEEGQIVESFFDVHKDDGTNSQLAKIHACIRKLAKELGYTFKEMKDEIKIQAGLCWTGKDDKEYCKSFGDCSKEELSSVIDALNIAGEMVNITF